MSAYDYYCDERDCESCGKVEGVFVEGTFMDASGTCSECGDTMWVYRWDELESDAAESAGDYARDER